MSRRGGGFCFIAPCRVVVRAQADSVETTATPGLLFGPDKVSAEPTGLHSDASSVFGNREAGASRASLDQSSRHRKSLAERAPEDSPSSSSLNLPASPAMSRSTTTTSARASDTPIRASLRSDSALTVNSAFSQRSFETSLQGLLKASNSLRVSGPRATRADIVLALQEMYSAVKAKPIYQLSGGSGSLLNLPEGGHSSASLVPNSSPYATWSPNLQRRTSHRSSRSTISGVATSNAYKRASVRGLGALLGASSLELVRSASPTPSTTTSTSDVSFSFPFRRRYSGGLTSDSCSGTLGLGFRCRCHPAARNGWFHRLREQPRPYYHQGTAGGGRSVRSESGRGHR